MTESSNDAAIRARLEQKNKQMKQVLAGAGILVLLVLLAMVVPKLFSGKGSTTGLDGAKEVAEKAQSVSAELQASAAQSQAARDAFKQKLVEFEESIEPALQNPALLAWQEAGVQAVLGEKDSALVHFAKGAFVTALSELEQAESSYKALIEAWQADFEQHYQLAQRAFDQEKLAEATLSIQQALTINPDEPNGLALQKKIADFPEIQGWFKQWDIAVAEKNITKQIAAMEAILALDAAQTDVAEALAQAKKDHAEQRFAGYIRSANQAIDEENIALAQQHLASAKRIFSSRSAWVQANQRLDALHSKQEAQKLKQQVEQASANDDWAAVLRASEQGLSLVQNDAYFNEQKTVAESVLKATQKAARFISSPKRLADDNIHQAAENFIKEHVLLTTKSPRFGAQLQALQGLMKDAKQPISVLVKSDKRTDIFVLGTGVVGKVSSKTVDLPPGDYIFEGRRKGYRNKRISVSLRAGEPQQAITLVCDERI